jgi:hypothetical protein
LGAAMDSTALAISRGNKYCHNGGTTFAPSYRARRRFCVGALGLLRGPPAALALMRPA